MSRSSDARNPLKALLTNKPLQAAIEGWIALSILLGLAVASKGLPFLSRLPIFHGKTGLDVLKALQLNAAFELMVLGWAVLVTRKRQAELYRPERVTASRELRHLLPYLVVAQVAGYACGRLFGLHPLSLHLPGTLYGLYDRVSPVEVVVWSLFNFIVYAALPYLYFRGKGYTISALNLRSQDPARDFLLIIAVLLVEGAGELGGFSHALFGLTLRQLVIGGSLAFAANLLGTGLPIMVFVYALLLPRYLAVTESRTAAIVLGGCTYALVHFFEGWTDYTSFLGIFTSIGVLFLQYFVPGVIKSVLTIRSGNAWVHLWGYHAIAPHVLIDAPHFVEMFDIR